MRILLTAYPDAPIWTFVTELARGLEREGVQIVLAVMGGPLEAHQRAQLRMHRNIEFHESTFRPEWRNADERELDRAGEWLLELADRRDVDVVHLTELAHRSRSFRAPRIITHVRSAVPRSELGGRVVAIPFGRSAGFAAPSFKEPIILATGDYDEPYGSAAALARVAPRISWPVFVIGQAPAQSGVTSLANVHFLGRLPAADTASVMGRAGVYAQPAACADGYAVLDAAWSRCALVLQDNPEMRELWDNAAMFVEPDDDESLRSMLIWLMNDADARGDLGTRALHRAMNFTAERMAARYLALYIDAALGAAASGFSTGLPDLTQSL